MAPEAPRPPTDELLSPEELSAELQVPVPTLYVWRTRGKGPKGLKVGRHLRYRRSEVDRWLNELADPAQLAAR